MAAYPMFSCMSEKPGPLVAVMDLRPPTQRLADDGSHAGNLVFHLDEFAATWEFTGQDLSHLGGRGDGVARIKTTSGGDSAPADGVVPLH